MIHATTDQPGPGRQNPQIELQANGKHDEEKLISEALMLWNSA